MAAKSSGIGKTVTFHGKFRSKILAARKERDTPGSFIYKKGSYYFVLRPKDVGTKRHHRTVVHASNPKNRSSRKRVLIYEKITRIEGTKGKDSNFPLEKFFHNFRKPYPKMYGLPDGSLLISSK
jgi:hypothetical protein